MVLTNNSSAMTSSGEKYYESIEFSNSCRQFYLRRLKLADDMKEKMKQPPNKSEKENVRPVPERKSTSIDSAMEKLRSEMTSLIEQDLSLMKQLLTLNETIEELKQKRMYGVSKDSLGGTRHDLSGSEGSVSDTDMYIIDDDLQKCNNKQKQAEMTYFDKSGKIQSIY